MSNFKILHITDLHLEDITSPSENLRKAFYKEFLDGLHTQIEQVVGGGINLLICTGDFVNKGKVANFPHAIVILNYLISKFKITNNDVAICIGNHDSISSLDKQGKHDDARKEFKKMEAIFHFDQSLANKDFYKIQYSTKLDCYILTFDSTLGSNGNNKPCSLSDLQIDEVIMDIEEKVPNDKPLFVLSHYPMILFNRSQVVAEVENWVDDHLWKSGNIVVERCYNKRRGSPTFWFFGDGHIPDFWSYNNFHHFLMTGMIGGNYINPTYRDPKSGEVKAYNKTNEAKVIQYESSTNKITINTFSYKSKAYGFNPHTGYWEPSVSEVRLVDNPFERDFEKNSVPENIDIAERSSDTITQTISTSVQKEIIDQIQNRKLYSFNRFSTSPTEVSLGWVAIAQLFQNNQLLSRCIEKTVEWIFSIPNIELTQENTILIGIDFWGAIFASQATILKGVENYCIGTKAKGEHNILLEKPEFLNHKLKKKGCNIKNIVFFTDVISTGNTIISMQEKIQTYLGKEQVVNWIAVSVISDTKQTKKIGINNFMALGSLCTDLRLPIVKIEDLPSVEILPIKYDIT